MARSIAQRIRHRRFCDPISQRYTAGQFQRREQNSRLLHLNLSDKNIRLSCAATKITFCGRKQVWRMEADTMFVMILSFVLQRLLLLICI
jgi:hypothetical protein